MNITLLVLLFSALAFGEDRVAYSPPSGNFSCEIPISWLSFEEEEPSGTVVHILGPDSPDGTYRTGIDIHWVAAGRPGSLTFKEALKRVRRKDKATRRSASGIRRVSTSEGLARIIEVREWRRLPLEQAPAAETNLHHYVALLPSPGGYFLIRLSSVQEVYLNYRALFFDFLDSFQVTRP